MGTWWASLGVEKVNTVLSRWMRGDPFCTGGKEDGLGVGLV